MLQGCLLIINSGINHSMSGSVMAFIYLVSTAFDPTILLLL